MATPLRLAVVALAVPGLFCTLALPAYAALPPSDGVEVEAAAASSPRLQAFQVTGAVTEVPAERSRITATTEAELRRQQAAAAAASARPSGVVANPKLPGFSLDKIVSIALTYQGVPYKYGGASPSGFDCSGFTSYVYAQAGVSIPRGSASQWYGGTTIAASAARPGDLVVMDGGGHIGIYLGNGQMIDAPYAGKTVSVRAIYTPNHWFVRYGI